MNAQSVCCYYWQRRTFFFCPVLYSRIIWCHSYVIHQSITQSTFNVFYVVSVCCNYPLVLKFRCIPTIYESHEHKALKCKPFLLTWSTPSSFLVCFCWFIFCLWLQTLWYQLSSQDMTSYHNISFFFIFKTKWSIFVIFQYNHYYFGQFT